MFLDQTDFLKITTSEILVDSESNSRTNDPFIVKKDTTLEQLAEMGRMSTSEHSKGTYFITTPKDLISRIYSIYVVDRSKKFGICSVSRSTFVPIESSEDIKRLFDQEINRISVVYGTNYKVHKSNHRKDFYSMGWSEHTGFQPIHSITSIHLTAGPSGFSNLAEIAATYKFTNSDICNEAARAGN